MLQGKLNNKTILVTGASSGIGRDVAIFLSKLGAKVIITARNVSRLDETFSLLTGDGHNEIATDISNVDNITILMDELFSRCGALDGLVHCAGIQHTMTLQMIAEKTFDKLFDINLKSALFLVKCFRRKGRYNPNGGSVVFLSSTAASTGQAGISEYSASKAAIQGLSRSLSIELAKQKIRVNCISPGVVETKMLSEFQQGLTSEQFEKIRDRHPLGVGKTSDIVGPIAFLLSDYSSWITGVNLNVDGGYTIG